VQRIFEAIRAQQIGNRALRLLDAAVTRLTAGLGLADLRGLLRGDPPRRPDPRLGVHTQSFWFHIKPRYYHEAATRFTHTFRLGLLATFLAIVEAITGLFLMLYYTPAPDQAYGDMVRLMSGVPFGQLMRDIHRLAAEALVVVAILHLARTFLTGSYKKPRRFTWATGVVLLIAVLFLSFSGYLLPWDQLAYWAVTIGTSLADAIPPVALGSALKVLLLGGPEVGADALLRFYMLHVLFVPLGATIFFAVHYFKVVRTGISLPASEEAVGHDTARRVPPERRRYYILDVLTDEIVLLEVVTVILLAVILLGVYRGAPLEHHADPLKTPLGIAAPWYFLWVQELLKLGNPTLMGVIIPAGFFAFLLLIPYLDRNPSRRARDRRGAIGLFLVVLLTFGGLTWLGRPGYGVQLAPAQAVVQAILPEEGAGPLRSLPWAALQPGEWDTRTVEISTAGPELRRVMAALNERLAAAGLPGARAKLVIAPWQPGLKKVTLRIFWQPESGTEQVFERSFFVHEAAKAAGR
jgi:ubiquinol-cytochrome c reductase cytochrome b subunit